ncbi:hypothetical protein BDA96_10G011700 [Sorghum bicolor]|uniref:Uncharacterized protein n=1 Tax=Sorghum bicolor TaxID=4558 RepID=A0A921Q144_SORBI|nr:hypothetical protein BDA96_10G011700 [Sorghum bicolor]
MVKSPISIGSFSALWQLPTPTGSSTSSGPAQGATVGMQRRRRRSQPPPLDSRPRDYASRRQERPFQQPARARIGVASRSRRPRVPCSEAAIKP